MKRGIIMDYKHSEVLEIKWATGHMKIILEKMFPTTKTHFKKLLKVVSMDFKHQDQLRETLMKHFQYRKIKHKNELENWKRRLVEVKPKVEDLENQLNDAKWHNAVFHVKKNVKLLKEELKKHRHDLRHAVSCIKQHERTLLGIDMNIEVLTHEIKVKDGVIPPKITEACAQNCEMRDDTCLPF